MKFNSKLPASFVFGSGRSPEWVYLNGPSACTKEQVYQYGQRNDRAGFERFAKSYADGRYLAVLETEFNKGIQEKA